MKEDLDPKYKSPNMDSAIKKHMDTRNELEKQGVEYRPSHPDPAGIAKRGDEEGQEKYKSRKSGGLINKIKDKLGVDKPDEAYGPKKESMDTPGNGYEHQCAIHVKSESFGEGRTITTQHADLDENGYIAWYDVMFEHGIEKYVPTDELEILVSESHMHSMKKKKKGISEAGMKDYVEKNPEKFNQGTRDLYARNTDRFGGDAGQPGAKSERTSTGSTVDRSGKSVTGYATGVSNPEGVPKVSRIPATKFGGGGGGGGMMDPGAVKSFKKMY